MLQIGKSEDDTHIYLSFAIRKENMRDEHIQLISSVAKNIINNVSHRIDDVTTSIRHASNVVDMGDHINLLKDYAKITETVTEAVQLLKESFHGYEEETSQEDSEESNEATV